MSEVYQGASPNARLLAGDVPSNPMSKVRVGEAMGVSLASHIAGLFLVLFVVTHMPELSASDPAPEMKTPPEIIWIAEPGPGGGGGGGGNRMPDPPRTAEAPGKDKLTVPAVKPQKIQPVEQPKELPKPEAAVTIPAVTMASGAVELPGAISTVQTPGIVSQGSGTGGGAGTGSGTGIGPGTGSGYGPGSGGGTGGGVYHPGNGVTSPRLIKEVKPSYTGDAMRAKIQGVVTMEAVVLPDGSVGNVQITRSLDPTFGLDQEAIKTVKQWRFAPGTRLGQPVPVLVEIEMTFTLR